MVAIKYCKKCNVYHPISFFDKTRSVCYIQTRWKKENKQKIIKILKNFDPLKSWQQQEDIIIELYSVGVEYRQFSSLFNEDIETFITFFEQKDLKYCNKCKQLKSRKEFNRNKNTSDGLNSKCKNCAKIYNSLPHVKAARELRNKSEEHKKRQKIYYEKNKEYKRQYIKKYLRQPAKYDLYANRISFCEEIRRDPNNSELLQVRCKHCKRWFNPTHQQVQDRIRCIEGKTSRKGQESNFYCSTKCKSLCPIYRKRKYIGGKSKRNNRDLIYHEQLKRMKIDQILSKNGKLICERCLKEKDKTELILHHIKPVSIDPIEAFDLDNTVLLCQKCHDEVHKIPGCSTKELVELSKCLNY